MSWPTHIFSCTMTRCCSLGVLPCLWYQSAKDAKVLTALEYAEFAYGKYTVDQLDHLFMIGSRGRLAHKYNIIEGSFERVCKRMVCCPCALWQEVEAVRHHEIMNVPNTASDISPVQCTGIADLIDDVSNACAVVPSSMGIKSLNSVDIVAATRSGSGIEERPFTNVAVVSQSQSQSQQKKIIIKRRSG